MPECSVIIVNWNGERFLGSCLSSLRIQTFKNFETILIDNGSQDSSIELVSRDFPEARIVALKENLGFCQGNNLGMRDALVRGAKYVLLLNNDTYVAPDFLSECLRVMEQDPRIAVVCPKIYFATKPELLWYAGGNFNLWTSRATHRGYKQNDRGQFDALPEISLATGCAMFVRASAIQRVGMFDERFWAYLEDVDWSIRFRRQGYKIRFAPKARVWHLDGASFVGSGSAERRQYLSTRNMLFLGYKNARWWQLPSFLAGFLLTHVAFYTALRVVRADYRACLAVYRGLGAFLKAVMTGRAKHSRAPRVSDSDAAEDVSKAWPFERKEPDARSESQ